MFTRLFRLLASLFALCSLGLVPAPAVATPTLAQTDWREAALADVSAIHALLLANHPGPVDPLAPQFGAAMAERLARTQAHIAAKSTMTGADYVKAMRAYVAEFDDGHVSIGIPGSSVVNGYVWPGFALQGQLMADGSVRVQANHSTRADVPVGASLHSCNGDSTDALLAKHVSPFWGQPSMPHARARLAWRLSFVLEGDNSGAQVQGCRFIQPNGSVGEPVALNWQPISFDEAFAHRSKALPGRFAPAGTTTTLSSLSPQVLRLAVPSFNMNGDANKALRDAFEQAMREVESRKWAATDTLVIDLRGNTGGNSGFGRRLAAAVWGAEAEKAANNRLDWTVDWRVSSDNIDQRRRFREVLRKQDFVQSLGMDILIANLEAAKERGEPLLRSGTLKPRSTVTNIAHTQAARVILLTDEACASACLDFMDAALPMQGVQHIGLPTSADSLYMDVNTVELPSKRASLTYPLKVYRNRIRGHQAFYTPAVSLTASELTDDVLLRWITQNPR